MPGVSGISPFSRNFAVASAVLRPMIVVSTLEKNSAISASPSLSITRKSRSPLRRAIYPSRLIPNPRMTFRGTGSSLRRLQLQLALVLFQERAQVRRDIQQTDPLLVVQRDWKPPQSVHAYAAFFSHAKFQAAFLSRTCLFFQLFNLRQQFFSTRF